MLRRALLLAIALVASLSCRPSARPLTVQATPSRPLAAPRAAAPADVPPDPYPDDPAIAEAGRRYVELLVAISPETATSLGLHARDAELDDRSARGHEEALAREEAMLRALEARFAHPRASAAARTDLALVMGALRADVRRKRLQRPLERQPDLYASPLEAIFLMTARAYAPAAERARNVVARLEKVPAVVEAGRANLREPPRVFTEVGIARAASARAFLEAQRPFLLEALPDERPRVEAALATAEAAYDDFRRFLQREVLPRSTGRFAAGRELFEELLRSEHHLEEKPEELLAIGKQVLAETSARMDQVAKRLDLKARGWPEVVRRLKGRHPTAEGLVDAYRTEVARARAFLVETGAVPLPPGDDLQVVETPPFLRSTVTAAYDRPPPFDPVTRGFFFVTPVDASLPKKRQEELLREHDHGDLVDTAVHEAYPGHHVQLSFARRHPSVVRKVIDHAVFSEGWALYAEELMAELGYYTDEERLMQLEWTLVRAARVVIDVGLHVGDMTFEQAVKVLTDEAHLERPLALSEVKRYTLNPAQPLSYLIGRQKILELRERRRARDGAAFSLAAFHADLLSRGTVPPTLLAREMFADER